MMDPMDPMGRLREMTKRSTCWEFDEEDQKAIIWAISQLEERKNTSLYQFRCMLDAYTCEKCKALDGTITSGRQINQSKVPLIPVHRDEEGDGGCRCYWEEIHEDL